MTVGILTSARRLLSKRTRLVLPAMVGMLSLFATLALWQAALRDQRAQLAAEVTRTSADVVRHLLSRYRNERQLLFSLSDELSFERQTLANWGRPYLVGQPIHRNVLWIDRELIAQRVDGKNDQLLEGFNLGANPARASALRDAAMTHEEVVLRADDFQNGRLTLMVAQPVYTRDGFAGFTAAILDVETLLRLMLRPHEEYGFGITVYAGDDRRVVYQTAEDGANKPSGVRSNIVVQRAADFGPLTLQLDIWPAQAALAFHHDRLPMLTLGFGLLVTMLLTMTIAAMQMSRRRSAAIEQVNHLLEGEVTRRKQAQQELQQMAAELKRSNRDLEHFAGIASHDLRAPLQKMKSFADLLDEDYHQFIGEEGRDVLQRLRRSVHRMQRLVDDLLELARVRSKGHPFTRVDLAQVARDVMSDLEPTLQASGGLVEIGDLPAIDADPTQMQQLVQNLVCNGLKFQKPGRRPLIRVEAEVIENPDEGSPLCRLRVTDNGIGFDNKYAERIFRPFERLHGQQEYEGSGLGLAVCAKIAERHGGAITAYGVPGEGATFVVTLPVRHAAAVSNQQRLVDTPEVELSA